jgi:hypothetical protein
MSSGPPAGLPEGARRSHALESLAAFLQSPPGLQVLDFGAINQSNLDYITGFGHRLYAADILRAYDLMAQTAAGEAPPAPDLERFLDESFVFPDQTVDCALLWDTIQFLPPEAAAAAGRRLHRVLAPDAFVLACFHPGAAARQPPCSFRILDGRHLQLRPRAAPRFIAPFTTRAIEKYFQQFRTVKFFMTRESLQEVVIRR